MRMTTCDNGHYYDKQANTSCPYCASGVGGKSAGKTAIIGGGNTGGDNTKPTEVVNGGDNTKPTEVVNGGKEGSSEPTSLYPKGGDRSGGNEGQTVYIHTGKGVDTVAGGNEESSAPVLLCGWLVIISEEGRGSSFPLFYGMNTIGREESNTIQIANGDNSISREKHAIIIYDYQNNMFFIKHGEGKYLSYLNGSVLLENKQLKKNDKIKVGNTELIFIPLCSKNFTWEN